MVLAWCGKCKKNIEIIIDREEERDTSKGKRKITYGKCSLCGTKTARIDGIVKFDNPKIKELEEKLENEKEKELKKMEEEKLKLLREQERKQVEQFLKQSEKNPVMVRNDLKVVKGTYYVLAKIFLVLFAIIIVILIYKTIYPEKFIPSFNSTCEVNLNETLICNNTNINTDGDCNCGNSDCNCGDNYCNITMPDTIEVRIINESG